MNSDLLRMRSSTNRANHLIIAKQWLFPIMNANTETCNSWHPMWSDALLEICPLRTIATINAMDQNRKIPNIVDLNWSARELQQMPSSMYSRQVRTAEVGPKCTLSERTRREDHLVAFDTIILVCDRLALCWHGTLHADAYRKTGRQTNLRHASTPRFKCVWDGHEKINICMYMCDLLLPSAWLDRSRPQKKQTRRPVQQPIRWRAPPPYLCYCSLHASRHSLPHNEHRNAIAKTHENEKCSSDWAYRHVMLLATEAIPCGCDSCVYGSDSEADAGQTAIDI